MKERIVNFFQNHKLNVKISHDLECTYPVRVNIIYSLYSLIRLLQCNMLHKSKGLAVYTGIVTVHNIIKC